MVRALTREEQERLGELFGNQGQNLSGQSSIISGSGASSLDTAGGRFTGEKNDTGFVNAQQYLDANRGKGVTLGEGATADVNAYTTGLSSDVDRANKIDIDNYDRETFDDFRNKALTQNSNEIWKPGRAGPDSLSKSPKQWNQSPTVSGGGGGAADIDKVSPSERNKNAMLVDTSELNNFDGREKAWKDFNDYLHSSKSQYDEDLGEIRLKDLRSQQEAIRGKKTAGDSWKTSLSDTDGGRTARKGLLTEYAKKQGVSGYGDASREFDAMFLEAESPNIIKNRLSSLNAAYNKAFDGTFDKSIDDKQTKHKSNIDLEKEIQGLDTHNMVRSNLDSVNLDREAYNKEIAAKRKAQEEQEAAEKAYREKKAREASGGGPAGKSRVPGAAETLTTELGGLIGRGVGQSIEGILPVKGAADAGERIGEKAGEVGKVADNAVSTVVKGANDVKNEATRAGNKLKKVLSDERAKKNVKGAKSSEFDKFMKSISIGKR